MDLIAFSCIQQIQLLYYPIHIAQQMQPQSQITQKIQSLTSKIQQDPYSPEGAQKYLERSQQYELKGDYQSAIVDLSKSLCVDPTCDGYVKRGKLYASSEMFYYAFMDFQEASLLYREEKECRVKEQSNKNNDIQQRQTKKLPKNPNKQTQTFLQKSTAILHLPQLKQISKSHESSKKVLPPEFNTEFNKLMQQIIEQKVNTELQAIKEQNKNYEKLLELVKKQEEKIRELEKGVEKRVVDYQGVFYREMEESTMLPANKEKCIVYYCTVVSEMEKYYLSAKVLSEFEEKITFEDYEFKSKSKITEKDKKAGFSAKIIEKIFKIFQKHQQKLERIGEIIKEIPYIGTAFKMIKPSLKICGWFEEIKLESQCQNILATRPSVSSFNKLSSKIAYEMCKYFKVNITTQSKMTNNSDIYKRNCWEKMAKVYHKFKRNQMGARIFSHVQPEEKNYAEEMANTHTTILMAGVAYGLVHLPTELELQSQSWQKQIFEKIAEIQSNLLNTQVEQDQAQQVEQKDQPQNTRKGCNIF